MTDKKSVHHTGGQNQNVFTMSEEQFRLLFEDSSISMTVIGEDMTILLANKEFEKLTGCPKTQVEGKMCWTELIAAEEDMLRMKEFHRLRRINPSMAPEMYDSRIRKRDGSIRDVTIRVIMVPGSTHSLASLTDVTEKKQTEEKFSNIFKMLPIGISVARMQGGAIVDTNAGFKEIAGWEHNEVIGRTSLELNFWADPADRIHLINELRNGRTVRQKAISFRCKNGELRYGMYSAQTMLLAGEECIVFVLQDITQNKEKDNMLRQKEEQLRTITANIPGAICRFYAKDNGDWGMSYASERLMELFGMPSPIKGFFPAATEFIYEKDREGFVASVRKSVETCTPWDFEGRIVKPSGEVKWFHGLAAPTRLPDSIIFDGMLLDITERKQAEEKSRQSEEKFTEVFMMSPDMVAITRMEDGHIIDVNIGFEEMTGWQRSEVIGRTSLSLDFWVETAQRDLMVQELKAGREVVRYEISFRRKDGMLQTGVYSARSLILGGEKCLLFIMQNITEKKRLEEERRKLEQQLYKSQKMDAIGQLAGGVAHDFNNILTGIQGNVSLLQMEIAQEHPHYQRLNRIEEQVQRGANLTRQLLGFARGGKYDVRIISVNDLIRKSAQFFLEARKEIEAEMELQENLDTVEADAGQIEQVLINIYINAAQAMPGGGRLHIQTTNVQLEEESSMQGLRPGKYIKISITDSGTGMDQSILARIFEPFFTTKSREGGTGLGLAASYGIIRNHGGVINAYSEPERGATFNIYLPASGDELEEFERDCQDAMISGRGGILLIDDENMIRDVASEMLQLLGYTVYQAAGGKEAIDIYRADKDKIDLVILDMILPGMNGAQVLEKLKQIAPDVKVILSSGYSMQGEVQKVMESGCFGFIQKPYLFTELSRIIKQVLYPAKAPDQEV
jgi:two-component system cell cycle sensor histidine kinase/response regulator CckA